MLPQVEFCNLGLQGAQHLLLGAPMRQPGVHRGQHGIKFACMAHVSCQAQLTGSSSTTAVVVRLSPTMLVCCVQSNASGPELARQGSTSRTSFGSSLHEIGADHWLGYLCNKHARWSCPTSGSKAAAAGLVVPGGCPAAFDAPLCVLVVPVLLGSAWPRVQAATSAVASALPWLALPPACAAGQHQQASQHRCQSP